MTSEPPAEPESGLPDKRGEFTISLSWIARFALTAAIGAAIGLVALTAFPGRGAGQASGWIVVAAGAIAATLLSIRKVHGWHVSTFVDGTIVGLAAAPIFLVFLYLRAAFQWGAPFALESVGQSLLAALWFIFIGVLVNVPCGWLAGFAYHAVLTAAERARSSDDDSD